MFCLGRSKRPSAPKALACGTLPLLFVVAALLLDLPGCTYVPGSATGTVEIDLTSGDAATGSLFSGQTLRATAFVEAGHVYDLRASLVISLSGTELADVSGILSGVPLLATMQIAVGSPGSEPANTFIAETGGSVTVEIAFPDSAGDPAVGDALEAIRRLISGPARATYEMLLTDLGFDDHGTSPTDASTLAVGPDDEDTGSLTPGDDADFFVLLLEADISYQLNLESTGAVALTSGVADRFGKVNFGVESAGGVAISVSSAAGVPGVVEFSSGAEEEIFLRIAPTAADSADGVTTQYAIGVVEVIVEEPPAEPEPPA